MDFKTTYDTINREKLLKAVMDFHTIEVNCFGKSNFQTYKM
jgi:hypothetical protein